MSILTDLLYRHSLFDFVHILGPDVSVVGILTRYTADTHETPMFLRVEMVVVVSCLPISYY